MEDEDKNMESMNRSLPTEEQIKSAGEQWKKSLDSPYRLFADKDFQAGATWMKWLMENSIKNVSSDLSIVDTLATAEVCKCSKAWGVAGRCVICEKRII